MAEEIKYLGKDYFTYSATFTGLLPNQSAVQSLNIQADSDFIWQKAAFYVTTAADQNQTAATRIIPAATVMITDTGSGRQLMDNPVLIPNIFGTGELPFILHTPKLFLSRSVINVQVQNLDAADTVTINLAFIGTKAFRA